MERKVNTPIKCNENTEVTVIPSVIYIILPVKLK